MVSNVLCTGINRSGYSLREDGIVATEGFLFGSCYRTLEPEGCIAD